MSKDKEKSIQDSPVENGGESVEELVGVVEEAEAEELAEQSPDTLAEDAVISQAEAGKTPTVDEVRGVDPSTAIKNKGYVDAADRGIHIPTAAPQPSDKGVPIKTKEYVKCKIGPKYWEFRPGVKYMVPQVVKDRLLKSGKLGVI
jgi:hypothetical protein